jgi:uncharacterized membrane protein
MSSAKKPDASSSGTVNTADKSGGSDGKESRVGFLLRVRGYLIAGILVTAPISITLWLVWQFVSFVDARVKPLLPAHWYPEYALPIGVPGIGLLVAIVGLTLIGMFAAGYIGRVLMRTSDRILNRVPVVRSIYGATKQVFETVLAQRATAFRQVAMIEYPCRGVWSMGFVTGRTQGEVQNRLAAEVVTIFIPATPNPTTGFLLFVPREEVRVLDMTVEQGLKMLISGGILTPPAPGSPEAEAAEGRRPGDDTTAPAGGTPAGMTQPDEARTGAAAPTQDQATSLGQTVSLKPSLMARLRAYFLAGVLVTAPIAITAWLAWEFIAFVDSKVKPLLPPVWNPETYLPFSVPGLGLIIVILGLTMIGMVTAGLIGRTLNRIYDWLLNSVPVVRSIYGATKQVLELVLSDQSDAFREVVLFEYPRRGCWAIGFITGRTHGQVQELTTDTVINVFLPTTPNPTSGFLLFVPRRDMTVLGMNVEEGIKMVVSGGIVTPPDRRPLADQNGPGLAASDERPPAIVPQDGAPVAGEPPGQRKSQEKPQIAKG